MDPVHEDTHIVLLEVYVAKYLSDDETRLQVVFSVV